MSKSITLLFLLMATVLLPQTIHAVVCVHPGNESESAIFDLDAADIMQLDRQALETKLGRKLKFKERLGLKLIKKKLKKQRKQKSIQGTEEMKTDGMAIAGFTTGALGLLFLATPLALFSIPLSILAVIFSLIGLKRIKRKPESKKGLKLAKAGLIMGLLYIFLFGLAILLLAAGEIG